MDINLDHLTFNELRLLNKKIVDRLRHLQEMDTFSHMQGFAPGDYVCFDSSSGEQVSGYIKKLNKKTISILTDDGIQYNVSPQLLNKVVVTEKTVNNSISSIEKSSSQHLHHKNENKETLKKLSVSKNSLCPCGSNKKFKRCCLPKIKLEH